MSLELRKTRKRDEKAKFDPTTFANDLISGINTTESLEEAFAFLDTQGDILDYRTYSESLFDIIVTSGRLAPGGKLASDTEAVSRFSVFTSEDEDDILQIAQNLRKLIKHFRYLEMLLEEEMSKLLKFIKAFGEEKMAKLAMFTAYMIEGGVCPVKVLENLLVDTLVDSGLSEKFICHFFRAWLTVKDVGSLSIAFKNALFDSRLIELFPANKRSFEYMVDQFKAEEGLGDIVTWQLSLRMQDVKNQLIVDLIEAKAEEKTDDDLIGIVMAVAVPAKMKHSDVIPLIFRALVQSIEWAKHHDIMTEQALRLFSDNNKLLLTFTGTKKSQISLINNLQDYCYDYNQNLMKLFTKLVLLMYKLRIVNEEAIVQWFHEKHSSKGQSVFLENIQPMMNWLQTAQEEA